MNKAASPKSKKLADDINGLLKNKGNKIRVRKCRKNVADDDEENYIAIASTCLNVLAKVKRDEMMPCTFYQ